MFFEDIKFDVLKHLGSAYKAVGPDWEAEFCLFDFFFFDHTVVPYSLSSLMYVCPETYFLKYNFRK